MAFSWFVYASIAPKAALALEDRLRAAIDELVERDPTLLHRGQSWGDVTVGEAVPSADDVAELSEAYDREVPEEVLDRLDACRSALEIERNGVSDLDPLQVSILRWIVHEIPECLIDWGDFQIVRSEEVIADLTSFASAGALGGIGGDEPAAAPVATAEGGDVGEAEPDDSLDRATATSQAIEAIADDPFLKRRFQRQLDKYPLFVKNYVKLLDAQGPIADAGAAKELKVAIGDLAPQLEKLYEMAVELAEEAAEE